MRRTQPFSKRHRESAVGPRDASARAVYCSEPADQKRKKTVSNTEGGITCGFSGSSRIAILMGMAGRDAIIYHLTVKRTKFRTCSFAMEYKVNAFVTCLLHCVVHSLLVSLRMASRTDRIFVKTMTNRREQNQSDFLRTMLGIGLD